MKYDLTILAPILILALILLSLDASSNPNNYIGIDSDGVISEIDHGGTYTGSNPVVSRDMATQAELDSVVQRLDAEDMRLRGGEVVGDDLILTVGDFAKSRGRNEVYTKEVTIDVSSLRGNDGKDGQNGTSIAGTDGKDGRDGENGLNGAPGRDGLDGRDGKDGKDGQNGLDGKDGTSTVGKDGKDGKDGQNGLDGLSIPRTVQLDLRGGIAAALASSHAMRSDDGLRVGVGAYHGQAAVALGGRKDDKTFTFSVTSRKQISVGFGMDL